MRVLMCSPLYFEVQEENPDINPWMKKEIQPDRRIALKQWHKLLSIFLEIGLDVRIIEPQKGLGDMCFSANAAWGQNNIFFMAEFHPLVWWRKAEIAHYAEWLIKNRCSVCFLPENMYFEGQGDIVTLNSSYIFGHGQRNSPAAIEYLDKWFKLRRFLTVRLTDPRFYHLDVSLHFARGINAVIWCPEAFDLESKKNIEEMMAYEKISSLELSPEEAIQNLGLGRINYLLNSVYVGQNEVMGWDESHSEFPTRVRCFIESRGGKIWPINVSEFGCSGGGVRCLTLFLD